LGQVVKARCERTDEEQRREADRHIISQVSNDTSRMPA
jgi:hypothetical protein